MIIERLARPKNRVEKKERVQPIAVPWMNPSPLDELVTKPRTLGSNRFRQQLDTLNSLAREMRDLGQADSATWPKPKEGAGGESSPFCLARQSPSAAICAGGDTGPMPPLGRRLSRKNSSAAIGDLHSKDLPTLVSDKNASEVPGDSSELTQSSLASSLREGGRALGRQLRKSSFLAAVEGDEMIAFCRCLEVGNSIIFTCVVTLTAASAAGFSPGLQPDGRSMSAGAMDDFCFDHGYADGEHKNPLLPRRKRSQGAGSRRFSWRDKHRWNVFHVSVFAILRY
jgi:hypothetical protein